MRTLTFFFLLPLALATLGINLWMNLTIRKGVEAELYRLTGLETKLAYSSLSFLTGSGGMGPLEMRVPGPGGALIVKVQGFEVDMSVTSLFSDHIEIEEVIVKHPTVLGDAVGIEYIRTSLPARLKLLAEKKTTGIPDMFSQHPTPRTYSLHRFETEDGELALADEKTKHPLPDIALDTIPPSQPSTVIAIAISDALAAATQAASIPPPAVAQ